MSTQKTIFKRLALSTALSFFVVTPLMAQDESATEDGWGWSITPYIWFTDTNLDLTANGETTGIDISFSDLLDTIDTSFQLVVETGPRAGKWSVFIDATYLETSDDLTVPTGLGDVRIDTDSEQLFLDMAAAFWPMGLGNNFNIYGGVRYIDLEDEFKLKDAGSGMLLDTIDNDRSFTDALVGARYFYDFTDRWGVYTRGDYSFGDTEGVWLAQAMLKLSLGRKRQHGILAGYRYKEGEFEENSVKEEYKWKGPAIAYNFQF